MHRATAVLAAAALCLAAAGFALAAARFDSEFYQRHVALNACFGGTAERAFAVALRVFFLAGAALCLAGIRGAVRVASRTPLRAAVAASARIGLAIVAALAVTEIGLRLAHFGRTPQTAAPHGPSLVEDVRYGWRFRPSQSVRVRQFGRETEYDIDGEGRRVASASSRLDRTRPTLVVTGESIGFGLGLDWSQTFAARVGDALGLQVDDVAVPRYGDDQAWLRLSDELPGLDRPEVVVTVFIAKQLRRDVSRERARLGLRGGELVPVPAVGLFEPRLSMFWTDEPFHGGDAARIARAIFLESARATEDRGALPVFLITNYGSACDCAGEPWFEREIFAGLRHVDVEIPPDERIAPDDFHPGPEGAKRISDAILESVSGITTAIRPAANELR